MSWLAAQRDGAQLVDFVSALFDIDGYLKRYAGGLVASDADRSISLTRACPDDVSSQLHCLAALVSGDDKQM